MSVSFCLPHPVAVSAFMICRGLCACTEMLRMCVLSVSFGSNNNNNNNCLKSNIQCIEIRVQWTSSVDCAR